MDIKFPERFSQSQIDTINNDNKFSRYVENLSKTFAVESIEVNYVDWFGPRPGFIHVKSTIMDQEGNRIPGCATLRGDAVGILLILHTEKTTYTVLVEQGRSPVGQIIFEIPAGSLDKNMSPLTTALTEIKEEVDPNLEFREEDLKILYEGYASPGGSDENITIVSAEVSVTQDYIDELNGALTGADNEDEHIKVHVVELDKLPEMVKDLKSMLAYMLFKASIK